MYIFSSFSFYFLMFSINFLDFPTGWSRKYRLMSGFADGDLAKGASGTQQNHTNESKNTETHTHTHTPDCSLRQGAGGMKFARNGPITCFLSWFQWRSEAYLGQKLEEQGFSIKKLGLEVKKTRFLRTMSYLKTQEIKN